MVTVVYFKGCCTHALFLLVVNVIYRFKWNHAYTPHYETYNSAFDGGDDNYIYRENIFLIEIDFPIIFIIVLA